MKKTILIVEDEPDIRLVVESFLNAEGYTTFSAQDGHVALREIEAGIRPDLILLDMRMPVIDGWQFCSLLSERGLRHCPILIMTAAADAEKRAQAVHANGWIGKPFQLDDLESKIKALLTSPPSKRQAS